MTDSAPQLPRTAADADVFARRWVAEWNALDVESVLAHFDDASRFTSPRAAATTGEATLTGKDALRAYWLTALAKIQSLQFTLDRALWDAERSDLAVVYVAAINGVTTRACEIMRFNADGLVIEGEALYGAAL